MDIYMTDKQGSALAEFLDQELKKRLMKDRNFSVRRWAKEIGIDQSSLNHMINSEDPPSRLNIEKIQLLVQYFGRPVLEVLGIIIPVQPSNPMYSPPTATGLSVAEKKDHQRLYTKEGK
jgi:transcriptional regulator with XRE-family HTH domain